LIRVQFFPFEKYLKVFSVLTARYMKIPDKKPYKAIVASKLKTLVPCTLKGLYNAVKPKKNSDIIKAPVKGFLKI
jgi:CRISPR/Cas system endoribonuclease Cas6 (RAMP superfamily)